MFCSIGAIITKLNVKIDFFLLSFRVKPFEIEFVFHRAFGVYVCVRLCTCVQIVIVCVLICSKRTMTFCQIFNYKLILGLSNLALTVCEVRRIK